jgi:hypothetical protein
MGILIIPLMIFVFWLAVIEPSSSRRKSKSFISMLLDGQSKTQKRNGSHRGVMCGPGGPRRRKR